MNQSLMAKIYELKGKAESLEAMRNYDGTFDNPLHEGIVEGVHELVRLIGEVEPCRVITPRSCRV